MTGDDPGLHPKFSKAARWSLKKLERHHEEEATLKAVAESTLASLQQHLNAKLEAFSALIGTTVDADGVAAAMTEVQENVHIAELMVLEGQIVTATSDVLRATQRLEEHVRTCAFLLDLVKQKSL